MCKYRGTVFMNNKLYLHLARNFTRLSRDGGFGLNARLLPFPIPDACCCTLRIRQGQVTKQLTKIAAKMKTKPKQTHSKPFFQRPIFDSNEITGIFDKSGTTFLCKTKPFFSKIQFKNKGLTAVSQSSAGVYPAPISQLP